MHRTLLEQNLITLLDLAKGISLAENEQIRNRKTDLKRNAMVAVADHVSESFPMVMLSRDTELFTRWQRVESFALPIAEALASEIDWDLPFIQIAQIEYKKFAFLSSLYPEKMVPSIHVDTVWHMHLLYTRSYQNFCREALQIEFLHHEPSGSADDESKYKSQYLNTLIVYEEFFGSPPAAIWGGNAEEFRKRLELQPSLSS